jgi:hypothetical protein
VTAWDAWHSVVCSATCGGGHQTRERSIATNPEYGGRSCGSLTDTRECNMQLCPVDCELTPWTDWTECTLSCGEGSQTRTRTVVTPPSSGGKACGARHYEQTCVHYLPCPVHCEVSEFTPWMHEEKPGVVRTLVVLVLRAALEPSPLMPNLVVTRAQILSRLKIVTPTVAPLTASSEIGLRGVSAQHHVVLVTTCALVQSQPTQPVAVVYAVPWMERRCATISHAPRIAK